MAKIIDLEHELRRVPASEIRVNPNNWRRHPPSQMAALKASIDEAGFGPPVLAYVAPDGVLECIDGHARLELMGNRIVPVVVLLNANEAQANKLLATIDPLAMMATNDTDALLALLNQTAFDAQVVNDLLEAVVNGERWPMPDLTEPTIEDDPGSQIDKAEELRKKWKVKKGQVWEIGEHRLMCGDAAIGLGELCQGETAVMAWSDPPYGVSYVGGNHADWDREGLTFQNDRGDDEETASLWFAVYSALAQHVTGDLYIAAPAGPPLRLMDNTLEQTPWERHQWLVWVKNSLVMGRSNYHYRHEQIWYGWLRKGQSSWAAGRDQDSVFEVPRPSRSEEHPTMKPIDLVKQMVENSSEIGETILDPFLGSGTTMVAAEQLGRICYGMEIEPKYVAVTLERMAGMGLEPRLVNG